MYRHGRQMEFTPHRALIERLDVLKDVLKLVTHQVDLLRGHRVEHEGVIGIGRVAEKEGRVGSGGHGRKG